ncbi:NRDE family protein [Agaribacter flavus]|uniref:NRDE family protein n=1 Tax=Agaribacter flavus TaxID=1902781 RepID=A0ABV7FMI7_9ALTE
MCILFIAVQQHPDYPLIIAANRDEFHQRPTLKSSFWEPEAQLLAGKDVTANGSWMGITRSGKLAALTNIRAPGRDRADATTRGELVIDYLQQDYSSDSYLQKIASNKDNYNGFNLLYGELDNLHVYNNYEDHHETLKKGVYGLSNAMLNTPWPKIDKGRQALADYCSAPSHLNIEHLFELLKNDSPADDSILPKTGVPIERERLLSSIFIKSPDYGTRSSTVLLIDNTHSVYWEERSFDPDGNETQRCDFKFTI